ncbi:acyl-CoA thioesterase [Maribacter sp. 2308TA10-17]|uniref:acyl-CoA thioesterase n=1 Tax=Maribacter sp. 2308TA10-17 TaxID=3386276 RepID=UPI0039BD742D
MNFYTRKWIKPEDLNPNNTLFGGRLLQWIDEEAALFSIIQLDNDRVVTKFMTEINFKASAHAGDIIEIGLCILKLGKTSITLKCEVRNIQSKEIIITIDNIVMVNLDKYGNSLSHGKTETTAKLR